MTKSQLKQLIKETIEESIDEMAGNWNDKAEEVLVEMKQAEKSITSIYQKISSATSNASKKPSAQNVKPIQTEISNLISMLRKASEKLGEIYYPKRKQKPWSEWDIINADPGRSAPQGPTHGW